jgi:hypothetical protein
MNVTGKHNPYQAKGHGVYELLTFYAMRVHTPKRRYEADKYLKGNLSEIVGACLLCEQRPVTC